MTVLEIIQRSAEYLGKHGVENPRLQIEYLLAQTLHLPRLQLYLNFEREIGPDELEQLRAWVKRRAQREPLQHILGTTSFCGLELRVSPAVLIPRPETEQLAELAWNSLAAADLPSAQVLDLGTGSGCLAIAIAVHCPRARFVALDLSAPALEVARKNALAHGVGERIAFVCGDGFGPLAGGTAFDLLVSNPPYIPRDEIASLQPEVRDYDPHLALDGGPDGLDWYRRIASEGGAFLSPEGRVMLELGDQQAEPACAIFEKQNWIVDAIEPDYSRRQRFLIAHRAG